MKTFPVLFLSAAAAALLLSCEKNVNSPSPALPDEPAYGQITVRIGMDEADTKAAYTAAGVKDSQINSVQVLVFDGTDNGSPLETDCYTAFASGQTSAEITLNVSTGQKTLYALVNQDREYFVPDDTVLGDLAYSPVPLSKNSLTNFAMVGRGTPTVVEYNTNQDEDAEPQAMRVFVKRMLSMIRLEGITVDFDGTSLEGSSFQIQELYLKNVMGLLPRTLDGITTYSDSEACTVPLASSFYADASNWYNKGKKVVTGADYPGDLLIDSSVIDITPGSLVNVGHVLFAAPNKTTTANDSHSPNWCARMTRLVIKALITGPASHEMDITTYYVLDLPVLESNKIYNIQNLHITRIGKYNDDSDDDIQTGRIKPIISVDPWNPQVENLNYEF